jgi:hypothetical protein
MKRQRSGFSIPKIDSAHIAAQHAKRDAANDEFMARMFGSTDSQSAGGAETKAPIATAPAVEPGTQHRGVTPEGTARVEDEPHEVMASKGVRLPRRARAFPDLSRPIRFARTRASGSTERRAE